MDIERLSQIVTPWAAGLNYRIRIYFFGSRLKGKHRSDSDLDLAFEFLDPFTDTTLVWFDYHEQWQKELSEMIGFPVHLELYDAENEMVRQHINEQSITLFQSPRAPESTDAN